MSTGIRNALMATPIGQAAIKQYAQGGEVEAEQIFEMAQTGASIEDILAGRARFFTTPRYRHAEVISDISDTLGLGTPIKKKREEEPYQDDAGGSVVNEPETDVADDPNDPGGVPGGFQGVGGEYGGGGGTDFGGGTRKGSENFGPTLGDRFQSAARFASNFSPMFQLVKGVGNLISPPESRRGSWDLNKDGYGLEPTPTTQTPSTTPSKVNEPTVPTPLQASITKDITNKTNKGGIKSLVPPDKETKPSQPQQPITPLQTPSQMFGVPNTEISDALKQAIDNRFQSLKETVTPNYLTFQATKTPEELYQRGPVTDFQTYANDPFEAMRDMGIDYSDLDIDDPRAIDVESQVDTFSEMSGVMGGDEAGSIGSDMDSDAEGWE
tara:strand:- start:2414 stop:3559 length:1146 start_codon:yes stop_codon:yes gene_type:complete